MYHALRFITDCKYSTHHCELYKRLAWPSLSIQRKMHWYLLIYTAIMGYLPFYLCYFLQRASPGNYLLCSQSNYNLCEPLVRTELGKTSFKLCRHFRLESSPKADEVTKLDLMIILSFLLHNLESELVVRNCFNRLYVGMLVFVLYVCL